ncbi:MAG TPA: HAMP domain-containing protein [Dehalococcoidia bacterium]
MKRLRFSIQTKVLLGTVVAIAVMAVFISVANIRQTQEDLERERVEQREQVASQVVLLMQTINAGISDYNQLLDRRHIQNMQETLVRLLPNVRAMTIRVKNYEQSTLDTMASTDPNLRGAPPTDLENQALQGNTILTSHEAGPDGEPMLRVVAPLRVGNTVASGTVDMLLSLRQQYAAADAQYNDRVRETIFNTAVISLLAAAIAVAIAWGIARAIVKPVRQLTAVAEQISMGEVNVEVPKASNDEIGDLAESFGRMVTAVKFLKMEAEASSQEAAA